LFVARGRQRFGDAPWVKFACIDVDLALLSQGLEPESVDVIVGVNVLHVARDISYSLREMQKVLKPHGYLILSEGSPPDRSRRWRLDVVFGFLRGWWDVKIDSRLRPRPGFLLPSEWALLLRACGYGTVHVLPGESWFADACRGGVVLAQKETPIPCRARGPAVAA
jgi:SAM-dependent methyltransferase